MRQETRSRGTHQSEAFWVKKKTCQQVNMSTSQRRVTCQTCIKCSAQLATGSQHNVHKVLDTTPYMTHDWHFNWHVNPHTIEPQGCRDTQHEPEASGGFVQAMPDCNTYTMMTSSNHAMQRSAYRLNCELELPGGLESYSGVWVQPLQGGCGTQCKTHNIWCSKT
jgi:hypothetical protein